MIQEIAGTGVVLAEAGRTVSGAVGGMFDTVSAIAAKFEQWNRLRAETASVIRLLYLEICKDLELLALLGDERGLKWEDPRLRFLISHFETGIMEMVLHGNEKEEVYRKLAAKGRIQDKPESGGRSARLVQKYENVLQAIRFIYVKMDVLRKLAQGSENNGTSANPLAEGAVTLAAGIRTVERLRNIEVRLVLAKRILGQLDENRFIS